MAGEDDWRFRKAQELGLVDNGPRHTAERRGPPPVAAPPPVRTASPPSAPPAAPPSVPQDGSPFWMAAVLLVGCLLAAALGWWLRGTMIELRPVVPLPARTAPPPAEAPPTVTAPATPPPAAIAPAPPAPTPAAPATSPVRPAAEGPAARRVPPPRDLLPAPVSGRPPAVRNDTPRAAVPAAAPRRSETTPSFNCRRAASRVARMICADPELGRLDQWAADAYRAALRRGADEARLDRAQAAFLNARDACSNARCISRVTRRRIRALDAE